MYIMFKIKLGQKMWDIKDLLFKPCHLIYLLAASLLNHISIAVY